jgi:hypothetical protein
VTPDLPRAIEPVARTLWGDPNPRFCKPGKELRWGNHGSKSVDLAKGTWFDHEAKEGGGVLDLVARETGRKNAEAFGWMRDHGIIVVDEPEKHSARRIVGTYDYVDENGEVLTQVVRFDPKSFRQRRPDSSKPDGWDWSVKGIRQVPYRLPELVEDLAMDRAVFIVEGEKAVDYLRQHGIPATCNAMGAKKWHPSLAEFFGGADVIIARDNDDIGREHGTIIAENLAPVAARVRFLDPPDMPEKKGLDDWMEANGADAEALYEMAGRTAVVPGQEKVISKFGALWLHELANWKSPTQWVVKNLIPQSAFGAFVGDPSCGKSFLALDLSFTIAVRARLAATVRWFGHRVEHGGVIYIASEGQFGFPKRVQALLRQFRVPNEVFPFVLLPTAVDLRAAEGDTDSLIAEIKTHAARMGVPLLLVIVDTLNRALAGGDENSSEDMGAFIRNCAKLQEVLHATVIPVHHKNASGTRERGHSSLRGALDFMVEVEKLLSGGNAFTIAKQKDEESGSSYNFSLKQVPVGVDDDGDPITSCLVVPSETGPLAASARKPANDALPEQAAIALRILLDLCSERGERVPTSGLNVTGVRFDDWRERCRRDHLVGDDSKPDTFRKAFERALNALRTSRKIGVEGDWVWPVFPTTKIGG